jgi:hypothetical protein
MKNKHYHYEVTGYNKVEKKQLDDVVYITTMAKNEKEAIKLAKPMVKKKYYRISRAWECLEEHGIQAEMQMLQIELQKKIYDLVKPSGCGGI